MVFHFVVVGSGEVITVCPGQSVEIQKDEKRTLIVNNDANTVIVSKDKNTLIVQDTENTVIAQERTTNIIEVTPIIKPVYSEEDEIMYSKRVDFISDNELYRGEAQPGTPESIALWRVRKITISGVDNDIVETWADGTDAFTKIWDNRLSYSYT